MILRWSYCAVLQIHFHMLSGKRKHWVQRAALKGLSTTPLTASLVSMTVRFSETKPM